jgi:hypothetical protein
VAYYTDSCVIIASMVTGVNDGGKYGSFATIVSSLLSFGCVHMELLDIVTREPVELSVI